MVIAIDFDGVLHQYDLPKEGRKMGPPINGARQAMLSLKAMGHHLMIFSCNRESVIADWMNYYKIPFDEIWTGQGKPSYDLLIDDKAIHFNGSWSDALMEVANA